MWCMDTAQGEEQEIYNLALRILLINFGAIHTTSMVTPLFSTSQATVILLLDSP